MIDRKYIIEDDNSLMITSDMLPEGESIEEMVENVGDKEEAVEILLSPGGIEQLKSIGLVNDAGNLLDTYETYSGDIAHSEMTLYDIYSVFGVDMIKSEYIMKMIHDEFMEITKGEEYYILNVTTRIITKGESYFHELSNDLIDACLSRDGSLYDFFDYDYNSFSDCTFCIRDISETSKDNLEKMGLPRNTFELLDNGYEEDEHPELVELEDDLKFVFQKAVESGTRDGSVLQCQNDFDTAFKNAVPAGCHYDISEQDFEHDYRTVGISWKFVQDNIENIIDDFGYYSRELLDCIEDIFGEMFSDNFEFRMPYYGWDDFDEESFNCALVDYLYEDIDINKISLDGSIGDDEPDLLDFDGENGEYNK